MAEEATELCTLIGEELTRIRDLVQKEKEALAKIALKRASKALTREDSAIERKIVKKIEEYADKVRDLAARKEELTVAIEKANQQKKEEVAKKRIREDVIMLAEQTKFQGNYHRVGSREKSAAKIQKKSRKTYGKKDPMDNLPSHLKGRTVRQFSPKHCENYSEYLYQRGLMIDQVHRERSKEAQTLREKQEVKGLSFVPKINDHSRDIVRDRAPLFDRTAEMIEKTRQEYIGRRSRSYRKHKQCTQSTTKKPRYKTKVKVVLDPEDYDNFFRKNLEWLQYRDNKREFLQSEKKRKEEIEDLRSMVPIKYADDPEYQFDEPAYEDMYRKATYMDDDRGLVKVSKKINFDDDAEITINEDDREAVLPG